MEEIQISTPLVWNEVQLERILVAKVLANRSFSRSTMETVLRKIWNLQANFEVTEITGNAFMFKFEDEDDYFKVLRGRPWSINGCLLNLMVRPQYKSCDEFDFSRCPVWIQMHNIPLEALCLENAVTIGNHVGEVLMAEDPKYKGRYLRNFLRARVVLDLRKALAYGFWLPRPDGRKIWIAIKYEKLQTFCFNCGKVGHDNRACQSEKLMSLLNSNEPRYGAWLSTVVCRCWDETLSVQNVIEAESSYVKRRQDETLRRKSEEAQLKPHGEAGTVDVDLFSINTGMPTDGGLGRALERKGNTCMQEMENEDPVRTVDLKTVNLDDRKEHYGANGDLEVERLMLQKSWCNSSVTMVERPPETATITYMESSMAMVLHNNSEMKEVLSGLGNLGLKRGAEEEWEVGKPKRRKSSKEVAGPLMDISNYAKSLKKSKTGTRRSGRKKLKGNEETALTEVELSDRPVEDLSKFDFIFRASNSRRNSTTADGEGGWPLTATEEP